MKTKLAVCGFLAAAGLAQAGAKHSLSVYVGPSYAWGSMGTARRSADWNQSIGCQTVAGSSYRYAVCTAHDAGSGYKTCRTYDAQLIQAAETVGSDSVVEFYLASDNFTCRTIIVNNDSRYDPRQP